MIFILSEPDSTAGFTLSEDVSSWTFNLEDSISPAAIEAGYHDRVPMGTVEEAVAGIVALTRRWSPEVIKAAVLALAPGGGGSNISGNAATVSNIGNLTGVVTSNNRTTSIADAALSIAKTSGLQFALDGKQTVALMQTAAQGRPVYAQKITISGLPTIGETKVIPFSGIAQDRPKYTESRYEVYWDGVDSWVIYDLNAPGLAWSSAEDVPTPQEVENWIPGEAASGSPIITASAQISPSAAAVGQLLRYGDASPFEWYVAKGGGVDTTWSKLVSNQSVNLAIAEASATSRAAMGITELGGLIVGAAEQADARIAIGGSSDAGVGAAVFGSEDLTQAGEALGVVRRKTTINYLSSSLAAVLVDELEFWVVGGRVYRVDLSLIVSCLAAVGGVQVTMQIQTNARTGLGQAQTQLHGTVKFPNIGSTIQLNTNTTGVPNSTTGLTGWVYLRPTVSGSVGFTTAQFSAGTGTVGVLAGSVILVTEI